MEIVYVLIGLAYAIVTVCFLIGFFRLCANVKKLRNHINPELPECYSNEFYPKFNFYISVGDTEKAKEALYREIMTSPLFADAFKDKFSEKARQELIADYQPYFEQLGMKIDFSKIKPVE